MLPIYYNTHMNHTPEQIASLIFNDKPKGKKYYNFNLHDMDANDDTDIDTDIDTSFVFEILIQILFEGFDILIQGLNNVVIDDITETTILALDPWFNSFGFQIYVQEHPITEKFSDNYCSAIINNDMYKDIFTDKKINKNFHFILNKNFADGCELNYLPNLYTIIYGSKKIIQIWFDFI